MSLPAEYNPDDLPMTIGLPQGFVVRFGGDGLEVETEVTRAAALLPGGMAGLSVNGYAVSSGSAYPEEAYELVQFLINHPEVVSLSGGTVPAMKTIDTSAQEIQAGPGGGPGNGPGGGPGGVVLGFSSVPPELEPILDEALLNGLPASELAFMDGVVSALNTMQFDGVDARTALDEAQNTIMTGLEVADARATTPITVLPPEIITLAAGEIALNFAVLGGGPGFAVEQQWEDVVSQFVEQDAEVGQIILEAENQGQMDTVATTYDCFYADSNLVPDLDLSLILNLDPLFSTDPAFDRSDFVAGVLEQVQENNQTWALPVQISPLMLRYNAALYNAAGIATPSANWSVSEFEDALRNLKAVVADGEAPLVLNAASQVSLLALIAAYGGLPVDLRTDPPTLNFTDPQTLAAIQQVLDLVKAGYVAYSGDAIFINGFGGAAAADDSAAIPMYSNLLDGFGGVIQLGPGSGQSILMLGSNENNDGYVSFPRGTQYNAVPFNMGTAYISKNTTHAEACYRFINFLTRSTELFNAMPTRYSEINNPELATEQGEAAAAFYRSLAELIADPASIAMPTNRGAGTFASTIWLTDVFNRYIAGNVVDLEADLRDAQQRTEEFLTCIDTIEGDAGPAEIGGFREGLDQCLAAANS